MNTIESMRVRAVAIAAGTVLGLSAAQGQVGRDAPKSPPDMVPLEGYIPARIVTAPARSTSIPLSVTTWTCLGPAPILGGQTAGGMPVSGRVAAVAGHPTNANILYAAAAGGGVWKTTDGGASWTAQTDGQATLVMGAIAVAPSAPNTVYAGTGEANFSADSMYGRGILKSTDGGATWTMTGNSVFDRRSVSQIAIDPTNANVAYAAIAGGSNGLSGNRGIWKTTDGGANWTNTTAAISTSIDFTDVVVNPASPQTVYMAVGARSGNVLNGVYKSTNGGGSWALAGNFPSGDVLNGRIRVALAPSSPGTLYAAITHGTNSGLYKMMKSTDSGATWTALAGVPNYLSSQGWYDTALIVSPTNPSIVYASGAAGSNHILKSENGGTSWTAIGTGANGNGPHVDHHGICFDASGRLIDGNDGGVWRLDDATLGSIQWTDLNTNLCLTQFVGIALDPSTPDVAFGGSQDNGTSRFNNNLAWSLVEGGDGGMIRVDPASPTTVYRISPVGSFGSSAWFRRSDDGGFTFSSKVNGLVNSSSALFYAPFFIDPANTARLLLGSNVANETTTKADLWARLSGDTFTFPGGIDHMAVGPASAGTIYATAAGGVFVTTNGGATWTQRNPAGVDDHFKRIAVDPTNSNIAYLVRDRFNTASDVGHVFRTANAGVSWTDISGNLPDLPTNCVSLVVNGAGTADDVIYVGTDAQVYRSTNLGVSWSVVGAGLPNVRVTDLEVNEGLKIIAAGTYGRGLWELSMPRLDVGVVTFSDGATGNGNGFPEPGETLVLSIPVTNPNAFAVTGVSATVAGGFVSYGDLAGGATVTRTINYTVPCATPCASVVSVSIGLSSALGSQTAGLVLTTGVPGATVVEGFDTTTPPALPAGWTSTHTGAEVDWVTSSTQPSSAPNAVFVPDVDTPGTATLVTPPRFVAAAGTHFAFRLLYNLENTFDACVLEISNPAVNGGAWQDILAAGGGFASGAYSGTAGGRPSWTGLSAGTTATPAYVTVDVVLPPAAAGQSVRFRFVVTCDEAVVAPGAAGVRIDNVPLTAYTCSSPFAVVPATQTVSSGQPASFSVTGSATGRQWRKNGSVIAGATGPTYSIASVTAADAGTYDVLVTSACGTQASSAGTLTVGCYANCDGSTSAPVLNVGDFTCFLQRYAGNDPYANCDGSTAAPVLNVADFTCFLQAYAGGCP